MGFGQCLGLEVFFLYRINSMPELKSAPLLRGTFNLYKISDEDSWPKSDVIHDLLFSRLVLDSNKGRQDKKIV